MRNPLYYYKMENGDLLVSDMFYTYDFGEKIYCVESGYVELLIEDKQVFNPPKRISPQEWTAILLKSNVVTK